MGFFGGTTIEVSSSAYNLAGDEATRPNFMLTSVTTAALSDSDTSITDQLQSDYLNGPSIKIRQFANWCDTSGYTTFMGMASTQLSLPGTIDSSVIAGQIPAPAGSNTQVNTTIIGVADYTYWVDQYVLANDPAQAGTAYTSTIDDSTNIATITFVDNSTVSFTLSNFNPGAQYLYVLYTFVNNTTNVSGSILAFIYEQLSGNTVLDGFFAATSSAGSFIPYIPVRGQAQFLSPTYHDDVYLQASAAYNRVTGKQFDDFVTMISSSSSLAQIDYAYVVFGVSLNVQENACKRYIYEFFDQILVGQSLNNGAFNDFIAQWTAADTSMQAYKAYLTTQYNDSIAVPPIVDTATPPTIIPYPAIPNYRIEIRSSNTTVINYDVVLTWSGVFENTLTGLGQPGANVGDLWFGSAVNEGLSQTVYLGTPTGMPPQFSTTAYNQPGIQLFWQVTANSYKILTIYGLTYTNFIYKGHGAVIKAADALSDSSESGFIIPLHTGVFKSLPITISTQMSTACIFVVFNTIQKVTTPFYETGFFKIVFIIAIIAISVATGGLADAGLLGASAMIGASLGFTGIAATIVGTIANTIAAMLLIQVIQIGATALLGPQLGALIGAIAGYLALQIGTSLVNTGGLSSVFNSFLRVDKLIGLTDALGKGFSTYVGEETNQIASNTQKLETNTATQSQDITNQYESVIGQTSSFDPLSLVDVSVIDVTPTIQIPSSSSQDFLSRTLMTGSDICDLSNSMITNFAETTISTKLQISQ